MKHPTAIQTTEPGDGLRLFQKVHDAPVSMAPQDRRSGLTRQLREQTGLDEASLERVVRRFYAHARLDPDLGPLFSAHVADWEAHYTRMVDFWASVGLLAGRYHRNALEVHRPLALRPMHFERWLVLFDQTLQEEVSPQARQHLMTIAHRIAATLNSRLCPR